MVTLIPKKNCKSEASDSIHKWGFWLMLQDAAPLPGCQASQVFPCCFGVMGVGTHACVIVCGRHQRTTSDILLISSDFFFFNFFDRGSLIGLERLQAG